MTVSKGEKIFAAVLAAIIIILFVVVIVLLATQWSHDDETASSLPSSCGPNSNGNTNSNPQSSTTQTSTGSTVTSGPGVTTTSENRKNYGKLRVLVLSIIDENLCGGFDVKVQIPQMGCTTGATGEFPAGATLTWDNFYWKNLGDCAGPELDAGYSFKFNILSNDNDNYCPKYLTAVFDNGIFKTNRIGGFETQFFDITAYRQDNEGFARFDKDADGLISPSEWIEKSVLAMNYTTINSMFGREMNEGTYNEIFNETDCDEDGNISPGELTMVTEQLGDGCGGGITCPWCGIVIRTTVSALEGTIESSLADDCPPLFKQVCEFGYCMCVPCGILCIGK